jgi:hypothetical protein
VHQFVDNLIENDYHLHIVYGEKYMVTDPCDKLILAEGLGVRLIYCKNCDIIELEIGAVSFRLNPNHVQQIANVMMKASLRLDRMVSINNMPTNIENMQQLH